MLAMVVQTKAGGAEVTGLHRPYVHPYTSPRQFLIYHLFQSLCWQPIQEFGGEVGQDERSP